MSPIHKHAFFHTFLPTTVQPFNPASNSHPLLPSAPSTLPPPSASIRDVRRWRESEIVHGRVSMLAALGFIVGEQLQDFPLFFNWDGRVSGE